jgi:hypothetical protein
MIRLLGAASLSLAILASTAAAATSSTTTPANGTSIVAATTTKGLTPIVKPTKKPTPKPNTVASDVAMFAATAISQAPTHFGSLTGTRNFGQTLHGCFTEVGADKFSHFSCLAGPYTVAQIASVEARVIAALDHATPGWTRDGLKHNLTGGTIISWHRNTVLNDDMTERKAFVSFYLTTAASSPQAFKLVASIFNSSPY